ncbi:ISAs1 family transposase [Dictyobacter formicarum]|uniref:ISAs1 family transposase n=1 Tax=Dictyobacter formicarum TaxID=2778368 RepID=A0ABQ3VAB5_9CHLR|nr:ISAs1 family transposase [Dictyobacter formicarum]GHO82725.1 ISAs1 family transposase [Dictyobacter formicarum]
MDSTTLMAQVECQPHLKDVNAHSLYASFQQIHDGRCKRGIRYPLALLLSLIVLAKLAGMDNMNGVVEWVRHQSSWLNALFGTSYHRWLCFSTYVYALGKLDPQVASFLLSSALLRLQAEHHGQPDPSLCKRRPDEHSHKHIAFDGKALRGTYGHHDPKQPSVHLCAFYEVQTGIVLAQRDVKEKENEISALKEMLTPGLIKGRILSADAMHTQRFFCQQVTHGGGAYLLTIKDNQPTLREELKLFFDDHAADVRWHIHRDVSSGHGRMDVRITTTSPDLRDYLARQWCGIEQVFCIERTCIQQGKPTSVEVHYGITSLTPRQADAQRIGALHRAHWAIEIV